MLLDNLSCGLIYSLLFTLAGLTYRRTQRYWDVWVYSDINILLKTDLDLNREIKLINSYVVIQGCQTWGFVAVNCANGTLVYCGFIPSSFILGIDRMRLSRTNFSVHLSECPSSFLNQIHRDIYCFIEVYWILHVTTVWGRVCRVFLYGWSVVFLSDWFTEVRQTSQVTSVHYNSRQLSALLSIVVQNMLRPIGNV